MGDIAYKLEVIKRKALEKSVIFEGDLKRGTFSGGVQLPLIGDQRIKGSYRIDGDIITVTVSKKPKMYNWGQIDSMLKGFMESQ